MITRETFVKVPLDPENFKHKPQELRFMFKVFGFGAHNGNFYKVPITKASKKKIKVKLQKSVLSYGALFLFIYDYNSAHNAAANEQQSKPQSQIVCVPCFWRIVLARFGSELLNFLKNIGKWSKKPTS